MAGEVSTRIVRRMAAYLDVDSDEIVLDRSLAEQGIDSLEALSIVLELEEEFEIEVPEETLRNVQTVGDFVHGIAAIVHEGGGKELGGRVSEA